MSPGYISDAKRTVAFMLDIKNDKLYPNGFTSADVYPILAARSKIGRIRHPVPFSVFSRVLSSYRKVIGIKADGEKNRFRHRLKMRIADRARRY